MLVDGVLVTDPYYGAFDVSTIPITDASIDQTKQVGGYTLVEASASAQLANEYLVVLRIDDALDVRPETRSGYHSARRVVGLVLQGQWQ